MHAVILVSIWPAWDLARRIWYLEASRSIESGRSGRWDGGRGLRVAYRPWRHSNLSKGRRWRVSHLLHLCSILLPLRPVCGGRRRRSLTTTDTRKPISMNAVRTLQPWCDSLARPWLRCQNRARLLGNRHMRHLSILDWILRRYLLRLLWGRVLLLRVLHRMRLR